MTEYDRKIDPMVPIHFLIIFGRGDFIQVNYPEDFKEEKPIRDQILPRTPDEIKFILSQSRIGVGWCRFRHNTQESIDRMLDFNGIAARCGISLEQFQERLEEMEIE